MKTNESELSRDLLTALEREHVDFEMLDKGSKEEMLVVSWLEQAFPIERWGRVAWDRVRGSQCKVWSNSVEMNRTFTELLDSMNGKTREVEVPVFLVWSNAIRPIMRVPFVALRLCGGEILDTDSDVWILCPSKGWCIEKYHEGQLCYGTVAP